MAGWKPIGSIYDTIRKRWFGPGDVFHKGDWLPRLYAREFEHTNEEPNVPEQGSIPTPPPPSSGGADPRVDQLLRDVAELKAAPPGSGQDPRVEGLLDRVATVEGKAARNAEGLVSARQVASEAKAVADGLASGVEQAAAKAQAATEAASAATAKATQVVDAANQAKLKAEDAAAKAGQAEAAAAQAGNKAEAASVNAMSAAQGVQGLQGKVQAAEAAAGRAEAKAGEAESTAMSARSTAATATTVANLAKRVTDKLSPLGLDETYQETRANARLAKEAADNAQIIAQGVGNKVQSLEAWKGQMPDASSVSDAIAKIDNYPDAALVDEVNQKVLSFPDGSELHSMVSEFRRMPEASEIDKVVRAVVEGLPPKVVETRRLKDNEVLDLSDRPGVNFVINRSDRAVAMYGKQRESGPERTYQIMPRASVALVSDGNGDCHMFGTQFKSDYIKGPVRFSLVQAEGPVLLTAIGTATTH